MYVNQSFSFHLGVLTVMQPGNYLEHEGEKKKPKGRKDASVLEILDRDKNVSLIPTYLTLDSALGEKT